MYKFIEKLYPIPRSLTGQGFRDSLNIIKNEIPIEIKSIKSGTNVLDWTVPDEWNIDDAYIIDPDGNKICDFKKHNVHLMSYSIPFEGELELEELLPHLYSLHDYPDFIPYLTTYYSKRWGFCLSDNQKKNLKKGKYKVVIKSRLEPGVLNYGEIIIPGKSKKEIFLTTYMCHPSMCNDNLTGPAVTTWLTKWLLKRDNRYTYRIIIIPETIGAIVYLSRHLEELKNNVIGGYVLTCCGDRGKFTYLYSRTKNNTVDKITLKILNDMNKEYKTRDYIFCGSDERQWEHPLVNLGMGSLMKTKYGEFDEYHTSADNLNFITDESLEETLLLHKKCITAFEYNGPYLTKIVGEPMLGKRGLYPKVGGQKNTADILRKMKTIIWYSDKKHDLIDISNILKCPVEDLYQTVDTLLNHNIIDFFNPDNL